MTIESAQQEAEGSAAALLAAMTSFEARLAQRIAAIMATIETSAGRIVQSEANLSRIGALLAEMKANFVDDQFLEDVADYLEGFDAVGADVRAYMESLGPLDDGLLEAIGRQYKQATADYLLNADSYSGSIWQPIANAVLYGVATNALLSNTITAAITTVVGSEEADTQGGVTMEATGTVESAPTMLQRTQTVAAAEQVGAEFFRYQGRGIDTTRPFCKARQGIVWHIEEIRQWGRDAAAGNGWDGMVEGTNSDTIFVYLGGWYGKSNNCRHVLVPLARRDVPIEDINRMRDKGLVD